MTNSLIEFITLFFNSLAPMKPSKIKQQRILAYVLIVCSLVLIPTKTVFGVVFLVIAIATLILASKAEKDLKQ